MMSTIAQMYCLNVFYDQYTCKIKTEAKVNIRVFKITSS